MKKLSSLMVVFALALTMFVGCSSTDDTGDKDATNPQKPDSNINGGDTGGNMGDLNGDNNGIDGDTNDEDMEKTTYQDGIYKAESRDAADGYKDYIEVVILNGKIDKVMFDGKNETGALKTADEKIKEIFDKEFETYPAKFMPIYSDKLVEFQTVDKVDVIVGAEKENEVFRKLANAALSNAQTGEKSTAIVDLNN